MSFQIEWVRGKHQSPLQLSGIFAQLLPAGGQAGRLAPSIRPIRGGRVGVVSEVNTQYKNEMKRTQLLLLDTYPTWGTLTRLTLIYPLLRHDVHWTFECEKIIREFFWLLPFSLIVFFLDLFVRWAFSQKETIDRKPAKLSVEKVPVKIFQS